MLFTTTHLMISTLLILAVCRTHVTYQPSKWPSSPRVAQLVRAPNQYLVGHWFDSRWGLRIFLCPMLVSLLKKIIFINYNAVYYSFNLIITPFHNMQTLLKSIVTFFTTANHFSRCPSVHFYQFKRSCLSVAIGRF